MVSNIHELHEEYYKDIGVDFKLELMDYFVNLDNMAIGGLKYYDDYTAIAGIFVHPDHRNKGLATEILNRLHSEARGDIRLKTHWQMKEAIKLYQKLGYRIYEYDDWNVYMELSNGYQ